MNKMTRGFARGVEGKIPQPMGLEGTIKSDIRGKGGVQHAIERTNPHRGGPAAHAGRPMSRLMMSHVQSHNLQTPSNMLY